MMISAATIRDGVVSCSFLATAYAAYSTRVSAEPKRRAWVLTLATASVVGPLSLVGVSRHVFPSFDAAAQFTDEPLARFLCAWFVCFLVLDCAFGSRHYPKQFSLFEGWFHHAAYIAFFCWGLSRGYSVGFASTLALELPTALLARGHCFPALRVDLAYGVAFLSLRVLFNAYLLWRWYGMADAPVRLWPCTLATLALHTTWFVKWCKSYARRRKAKEG